MTIIYTGNAQTYDCTACGESDWSLLGDALGQCGRCGNIDSEAGAILARRRVAHEATIRETMEKARRSRINDAIKEGRTVVLVPEPPTAAKVTWYADLWIAGKHRRVMLPYKPEIGAAGAVAELRATYADALVEVQA